MDGTWNTINNHTTATLEVASRTAQVETPCPEIASLHVTEGGVRDRLTIPFAKISLLSEALSL
jgi:hypothetical protein